VAAVVGDTHSAALITATRSIALTDMRDLPLSPLGLPLKSFTRREFATIQGRLRVWCMSTWSPKSLFNRRAYGSENLRHMPQTDFCNTILPSAENKRL
jgi:hypothetical protein